MIPNNEDRLTPDYEVVEQPTHTYKLERDKNRMRGYTDTQEAMKQAIYKILHTERYKHEIYSWNYGIELRDLFGQPLPYVYPEIERRVTEALLADDRITDVKDFTFENPELGVVFAKFKVDTVFGTIDSELDVEI